MQYRLLKIFFISTLLAGIALFLISNLLNYSDEKIVSQIEANLILESKFLRRQLMKTKQQVEAGNFNFEYNKYPTYLFQKNKLISWNNYEFDVSELLIASYDFDDNVVTIRNSTLMFQKTSLKNDSAIYTIITFYPIEIGFPFNNQYLSTIPNPNIIPAGIKLSKNEKTNDNPLVIPYKDKPLFTIVSPHQKIYDSFVLKIIQILTVFFTIGLIVVTFIYSLKLAFSNKQALGLAILVSVFTVSRSLMVLFNYPNAYLNINLFRSKIFMSSAVNSSIGDLFLNIINLLIIILFLVINKDWILKKIRKIIKGVKRKLILIALIFFSFMMLQWYFEVIFNLLSSTQIKLDIFTNVEFSLLSITAYLSIIGLGISYFFVNDLIYKIVFPEIKSNKEGLIMLFISIVFYTVIAILSNNKFLVIVVLQSIYVILIYYYESPIRLSKLKFGTFIYGLLAIFLLSITASLSVYKSFKAKELIKKEKLATKLLIDRDVETEYFLRELIDKIKSDVYINSLFINPQSPKKHIKDRIERYFNYGYFDIYNVKIALFDKKGNSFDNTITRTFSEIKNDFTRRQFKTDFGKVYFQSDEVGLGRKRYVCFLDLQRYNNRTGFAVLDLRLKKHVSKSVYPELLLERKFIGENDFDYAIYNNNEMIYNVGDFNYKAYFNQKLFSNLNLYELGVEIGNIHHLGVKEKNKTIIISSQIYPFWRILSNFSFYFILMLLSGISILILNAVFTRKHQTTISFSTRILIYIGAAFAIPIAFVGFAVINTINTSYKLEIEKSYKKKTIAISETLVSLMEKYVSNEENKEEIINEVSEISKAVQADINIYNTKGKLITTSQPKIFESGLLTLYINSKAYQQIVNEKKDKVIIDEFIGNLTYKSSYIAIRSFENDELLGIMSSPFFGSKNHLNRQETEVFNNIINITTLIFIFSIWFTYIAVRRLTNPLILIASKLKSIEFKEKNEPLNWKTNDEIGILIQEYNKMVEKLAISKKELAKNEKETAWREIAKQVAHEIKNPLTPMKLTLQHLDRMMGKDDIRHKSLKTLLSQMDTLDEIVTSFSHFAKMPDPDNVNFNIQKELEKIIDLHSEKNILFTDMATNHIVNADKKLFGRIFNNIILNAFQAMVEVENPELNITLINKNDKINISFEDIGSGISKKIQEKVFIPNFSTKDSGSGIGLAVAKRGIENAGGAISFKSKVNKGTIFFIELPVIL